ncbi:hypothetical protein AVEN_269969-1 [Araneus ventricosus]|uniref:Uncharacterized protein n=1 Tax=Araneus ventricosus TaxID=182803 RepID=A0A4Y2SUS4_ARAVE|nr:hypothetical protein AVEN_269969-1 [Araneus ventricosus]
MAIPILLAKLKNGCESSGGKSGAQIRHPICVPNTYLEQGSLQTVMATVAYRLLLGITKVRSGRSLRLLQQRFANFLTISSIPFHYSAQSCSLLMTPSPPPDKRNLITSGSEWGVDLPLLLRGKLNSCFILAG